MKRIDENISSFLTLLQGAWLYEKYYKSSDGNKGGIMRTRAFLAAVRAAQEGRPSEFHDYLRPVLNGIRLDLDWDGTPDVQPINVQDDEQLDGSYIPELQWAYAAFKCLEKIRWEELKNCKRCGDPFYGGGNKKKYCTRQCMTKENNYKADRDQEKAKIRNFIHRLQKRGSRVEPLLAKYLKGRKLKMSCLPDKWQKVMRKWNRDKARKVKKGRA